MVARTVPKQYGGYGAAPDIVENRIISEELAAAHILPMANAQGTGMKARRMRSGLSEEQTLLTRLMAPSSPRSEQAGPDGSSPGAIGC
ncbi:MAG: hypothetical protein GKR94_03140 [Gammaproteobacteria bacterium]|nr:hypothetical protein [Gammaproteobacteria bacterium]